MRTFFGLQSCVQVQEAFESPQQMAEAMLTNLRPAVYAEDNTACFSSATSQSPYLLLSAIPAIILMILQAY